MLTNRRLPRRWSLSYSFVVYLDMLGLTGFQKLTDYARTLSPHLKYHAPSVIKSGMYSFPLASWSPPPTSREPAGVYCLVPEGQNGNLGLEPFIRYRGNLAMRAMPIVLGTLLMAIGCLPVAAQKAASAKKVYYYSSDQVKKTFGKDPANDQGTNGILGELLDSKTNPLFKGASSYKVTVRRKERKQDPEFHKSKTHIFYVLEGSATLVTGGKISGSAEGVEDEGGTKFHGQTVEGGETWKLDKGSIIVVPAGVDRKSVV